MFCQPNINISLAIVQFKNVFLHQQEHGKNQCPPLQHNLRNSSLPCSGSCSISHPDLVNPRHCARRISSFNLLLSNYSKYLFQESQGENEGTENFAQNILQRKKHFTADRNNLCSCIPSHSPTCQKMGRKREMGAKIVCRRKEEERTRQLKVSKTGDEQKERYNGQYQGVRDLECSDRETCGVNCAKIQLTGCFIQPFYRYSLHRLHHKDKSKRHKLK